MAKVQQKKRRTPPGKTVPDAELPQRINYMIIVAGLAVVILGVLIMASGDAVSSSAVTIAPIIMFIGYCVIIPLGIIFKQRTQPAEGPTA